jgi:hypothetical protein
MKLGDIIRCKIEGNCRFLPAGNGIYLVRRLEEENDWVFVYGYDCPMSISLMEIVSESR